MMRRLALAVLGLCLFMPRARGDEQLHHRPEYTLHIGDVIDLNYRLTPEFNQTVTIQPDGCVNLEEVGNVKVAGLTLEQAHDQIVTIASNQLNHPELSITLKQFQQPYVVVAGEVARPGKIEINENTTALQAIMLAGGFAQSAEETHVVLFRHINADTAEVRQLNLHNIKKDAQLERDAELQPGDMLLVTRNKLEHLSRFMKAANLGVYFNPFPVIP
ncbi:MAG TPA: polysaccharide biosynthesis/export family protein [Terracidiphilus sp.]|jgi:polysaccharide export outer membrane protein|nr:polysaccharide biosynthesis/export family protein [Terracidiphilus sp.]